MNFFLIFFLHFLCCVDMDDNPYMHKLDKETMTSSARKERQATILLKGSKAPILQFSKCTRTGYFAGTGTHTVRVQYAPMTYQFYFFVFIMLVRLRYGGGTLRVLITVFFFEKMSLSMRINSNYSFFFF